MRPPAGLAPPVCDVVCLASMSALDFGRQRMVMAGLAARAKLPYDPCLQSAVGGRPSLFIYLSFIH